MQWKSSSSSKEDRIETCAQGTLSIWKKCYTSRPIRDLCLLRSPSSRLRIILQPLPNFLKILLLAIFSHERERERFRFFWKLRLFFTRSRIVNSARAVATLLFQWLMTSRASLISVITISRGSGRGRRGWCGRSSMPASGINARDRFDSTFSPLNKLCYSLFFAR